MGFPENILDADERVVLHQHPHWKTIVFPIFWLVVIALIAGAGVAVIDNTVVRLIIVIIALVLLLYLTVRPFVRWLTTHFVLTTHRVLIRQGFLHRSGRDVPLARINDVSFENSLFERMLGCGTLVVESAGERGQVILHDVPRAEFVQSTLYRLVEDDTERRAALHRSVQPEQQQPPYPQQPPSLPS